MYESFFTFPEDDSRLCNKIRSILRTCFEMIYIVSKGKMITFEKTY